MRALFFFGISLALAACGVADVGLSAATNAKLQAEQARQARETSEQIKQQVEAINKTAEQRVAEALAEKQ